MYKLSIAEKLTETQRIVYKQYTHQAIISVNKISLNSDE